METPAKPSLAWIPEELSRLRTLCAAQQAKLAEIGKMLDDWIHGRLSDTLSPAKFLEQIRDLATGRSE